ncbi:Long-chain fatty acid--CoA ligase [Comamonas aquatilis]|uniref:AMP-binding protein n=1 Tax=Comamonas aquatilis TaxID=1778406 RepID=UPI0039EDEEFB
MRAEAVAPEKAWLAQYPGDIPHSIDLLPAPSLKQLLADALACHGERTAVAAAGKRYSYRELDTLAASFAAWLQQQGVAKGDRVALMLPNTLAFVVGVLGVLRAGGTVVTVNPMYTPRELAHQLADSGAQTILVFDAFVSTLEAVLADRPMKNVVVVRGAVPLADKPGTTDFEAALAQGATLTGRDVTLGPDDIAFLQYTGGTTGVSKGATLTHRNLLANISQVEAWMGPALGTLAKSAGLNMVVMLPMYHIFALTFCLMYGLRSGLQLCLIANPRDLAGAIQALKGTPVHILPGVNTLFTGLMAHPDFKQLDVSDLRLTIGGGAAVHQAVSQRWSSVTGLPIIEGYGLSETSPVATCNLVSAQDWTGTIGLPVPDTEIAIRDDQNADVPVGDQGEICIRGPQVMTGYWQRPDETAKVMTVDGYFKTGDVGVMDEKGFVKIVDRKKDMILVSGFNVFPNEIEEVVSALPGVLEVAAVGVPDERSGEAVKVFIVKRDPGLSEEQIAEHCREQLTAYKRPKQIAFLDALPKSTVGKVLRRELRA